MIWWLRWPILQHKHIIEVGVHAKARKHTEMVALHECMGRFMIAICVRVFGKLYHTRRGRWYNFACGLLWWPFCAETYSLAHNVASLYLGTNLCSGRWGHPFFPFQKLIYLFNKFARQTAKHWNSTSKR